MNLEFVVFENTLEHHLARVSLTNTIYKNHVYTAEQTMAEMAGFQPDEQALMELVFVDGRCVATFEAIPFESPLANHAFFLDLIVHPDFSRNGIGSQAIRRIERHCSKWGGMLEVQIRENWDAHQVFYAKHSFVPIEPTLWLALEPQHFSSDIRLEPRLLTQGITLQTWAELADSKTHQVTLLEFRNSLAAEFNPSFSTKILSQTYFDREVLGAFGFKPEFCWIAWQNHQIVGALLCTGYANDPTFFFEFGGVAPELRRTGIATALVVRAIQAAKTNNFSMIEVHLDPLNVGTLPLLERLGFSRQPGYVYFRKFLEP